jgi:nucleoporin NUP82
MSADDWATLLAAHPIFSPSPTLSAGELDASTSANGGARRQVMVLKDADLVVAAGSEIRITSLGAARPTGAKGYKVFIAKRLWYRHRSFARLSTRPTSNSKYTKLLSTPVVSSWPWPARPRSVWLCCPVQALRVWYQTRSTASAWT